MGKTGAKECAGPMFASSVTRALVAQRTRQLACMARDTTSPSPISSQKSIWEQQATGYVIGMLSTMLAYEKTTTRTAANRGADDFLPASSACCALRNTNETTQARQAPAKPEDLQPSAFAKLILRQAQKPAGVPGTVKHVHCESRGAKATSSQQAQSPVSSR
jgi:hypothetical protein